MLDIPNLILEYTADTADHSPESNGNKTLHGDNEAKHRIQEDGMDIGLFSLILFIRMCRKHPVRKSCKVFCTLFFKHSFWPFVCSDLTAEEKGCYENNEAEVPPAEAIRH